jgi:hypothetical protein
MLELFLSGKVIQSWKTSITNFQRTQKGAKKICRLNNSKAEGYYRGASGLSNHDARPFSKLTTNPSVLGKDAKGAIRLPIS